MAKSTSACRNFSILIYLFLISTRGALVDSAPVNTSQIKHKHARAESQDIWQRNLLLVLFFEDAHTQIGRRIQIVSCCYSRAVWHQPHHEPARGFIFTVGFTSSHFARRWRTEFALQWRVQAATGSSQCSGDTSKVMCLCTASYVRGSWQNFQWGRVFRY